MGEMYKCRDDVFLHAEKISKIYPGTKALDQVSFDLLKGKVNVLIGENGAGKSTLMKMIAGIEQPNEGKMYIGDQEVYFKNTTEARKHGIGIIHQELSLFPNLNVYQNIYMNKEKTKGKMVLDDKNTWKVPRSTGETRAPVGPSHEGGRVACWPAADDRDCQKSGGG